MSYAHLRTGLTFDGKANRLILALTKWKGDITLAAQATRMTVEEAQNIMEREDVLDAYQNRIDKIETEMAIQTAKAELLTTEHLSAQIVDIANGDPDVFARLKAIDMGFKKLGVYAAESKPGSGGAVTFQIEFIQPKEVPALPPTLTLSPPKVSPAYDNAPDIEFIQPKTKVSA